MGGINKRGGIYFEQQSYILQIKLLQKPEENSGVVLTPKKGHSFWIQM